MTTDTLTDRYVAESSDGFPRTNARTSPSSSMRRSRTPSTPTSPRIARRPNVR